MISKELEVTLNQAFKEAKDNRHEFITVEHLLLALLDNPTAYAILSSCGAKIEQLREELEDYIDQHTPYLEMDDSRETQPTLGFQRVLQRAIFHVQSSGKDEVTGANVLVAIFGENESQAVYCLSKQDISRLDVINFIAHGISKVSNESDRFDDKDKIAFQEEQKEEGESLLSQFSVNLNERAKAGGIDPLIGREDEIERTIQTLCRRRKNNPLLVGEAGVGKTAIAEGLAKKIVDKEVPDVLADATIYSLDLGSLVAGTKYRGDFEKRLKGIIKELKAIKGAVLFIDEIHVMIGAGSASGGVMDASNLIKPVLANGELRCIGSTTFKEYRGIFEKDHALTRRFQKIDVNEPSVEETYKILKGLREHYEKHHQVHYTLGALKMAAELSDKYINDRHLPDKAIDVIDEAGANRQLKPLNSRKKTINNNDIESIISKIARIPPKTVSRSDKDIMKSLERDFKMLIFGQDKVIEEVVDTIKMSRSGLGQDDKPVASFLFAGPTGVGKTEVSKQLAKLLGIELIRFDMSEYMERHTVSRLIGAPPGYVGYDQGGLMTEAITKTPHCILLLDEIEKAHPDVFNILLQVMDHGTLTDNNGRKADFRNVTLIMTTNSGATQMSRNTMGFTRQDHSSDGMETIKKQFSPEFRNRLDKIVQFAPLELDNVKKIVDKFIIQLESKLDEKHVSLNVSESARQWLAEEGYDQAMGARPMERVIRENIKKPLADLILFGDLQKGGTAYISLKDGKIAIKAEASTNKHKEKAMEE